MRLGILGASEIALRRFLPALKKCEGIEYAGIASRTFEKAVPFKNLFGGEIYSSYDALLADDDIDAVYVPLPPALHYEWGKKVLNSDKHLLMEKPFTVSYMQTKELIDLAQKKGLAVHENYMFLYHSQMKEIKDWMNEGRLGDIRLIRAAFGFPKRGVDDFRYNKALGGGALLDCGGYPIRIAAELLGETTKVVHSKLIQPTDFSVDLYGNAVLENADGLCAQVSFGMDNAYQCQLEIWGSQATLIAPRVFTAPSNFSPNLLICNANGEDTRVLEEDDSFEHSIKIFQSLVETPQFRSKTTREICTQAALVEAIKAGAML